MTNKILYILGIFILIVLGFFSGLFGWSFLTKNYLNEKKIEVTIKEEIIEPVVQKETTLFFVGDMMLTRGVQSSVNKNFEGDYNKLFENLSELKNADILFGNLEGPVSDIGNNVGSKYSFRMNPNVLPAIKEASFDILSFANNHVGDWNVNAFKDTITRLDSNTILKTGAGMNKEEAETPTIIEKNGVKFGYLGLSDVGPTWMEAKENQAGILLASDILLPQIIQKAKAKVDVLIISIHWGDEYKTIHNSRQEKIAKILIDNGADLVIGHHPHVVEDIEEYKGKPIVYSLGNFIFDQYFSVNTMQGMLFKATYTDKDLKSFEKLNITLNKKYQPEGIYTDEELKEKDEIASNVCPKPKKEYTDMWLSPIDQNTSLTDKTYIPSDLKELSLESSTKRGICMTKDAKDNFEALSKQAQKEGLVIKISSGFRSYETQKIILATEIKNGNPNAEIAVAKAGYSEHQLGTAGDVTGQSIKYLSASKSFEKTKEALWMEEHAKEYGFTESFPLGKEEITGYMYEPWHYRFVGADIANKIIKSKLTINQYLKIQ